MHSRPWSDGEMLRALELRDAQGLSAAEIGKRMGRSRASVLGVFKRISDDLDRCGPCRAVRADNRDGGMPPGWWRRGAGLSVGVRA